MSYGHKKGSMHDIYHKSMIYAHSLKNSHKLSYYEICSYMKYNHIMSHSLMLSNHPHLYTNFTTFSILARYQPGPWIRSCGMVSLRDSQWEYNYQMAWLWFTCLVLMTKPLLLTKDNGWKSSTIWATIPLWAVRALGSSLDQKLEGGGASSKSWESKVDF